PIHLVRVPDLDLRGDLRRDLGPERVEPLLGVGSEGDMVVHHVDDLRGLPARARDRRLEGPARGGARARRLRKPLRYVLRREPMDRGNALVREMTPD